MQDLPPSVVNFFLISAFGMLIFLVGQSWLVKLSWKKGWALFLITAVFPFIYPFFDWPRARLATIVTIVGLLICIIFFAMAWNDPTFQHAFQEQMKQSAELLGVQYQPPNQ